MRAGPTTRPALSCGQYGFTKPDVGSRRKLDQALRRPGTS
jgi:hypothetical protein